MKKARLSLNFIVSALMTLGVMFFAGGLGDYYFDLNDDVLMKDLLSGAYSGTPAGHNIQMLYPISALISLFYRVYRGLDWYGIFLCGCMYLCVFILFYRTLSLCKDNLLKLELGLMEFLFMLGVIGAHFLFVQYTFLCGFMSAVSAFLILTHKGPGKRDLGLAAGLLILAYLIRSEMLLLTLPMIGVAILIRWSLSRIDLTVEEQKPGAKSLSGEKKALFTGYVKFLLVVVAGLVISSVIHRIAYASPDWKEFTRLFDARTELYDFQYIPDYAQNKAFYNSIGLSKSEQQLLINYNFGLDEEIGTETLKAVAEYADTLTTNEIPLPQQLVNAIPEYLYRLRHMARPKSYQYPMTDAPWNLIVLVLYVSVALLYLFSREKEKKLPVMGLLAVLFACRSTLWLYIIVRGRDPVRITHPLYLVEIMILLGMLLIRANYNRRDAFIPVVVTALIAMVSVPDQMNIITAEMAERDSMRDHYGALYEYFDENADSFYFVDVYTSVSVADAIDYKEATFSEKMFDKVDNSEYNHDIMGGWASKSPLYYDKLENNGFESMEEALLRDNVYVVQLDVRDTDWIVKFYADKGTPVEVSLVDNVAEAFNIYAVRAVK
jgi:hypothetical protein